MGPCYSRNNENIQDFQRNSHSSIDWKQYQHPCESYEMIKALDQNPYYQIRKDRLFLSPKDLKSGYKSRKILLIPFTKK